MSHAYPTILCQRKIRLARVPNSVALGIKLLDLPSPWQSRNFVKADRTPPRLCQRHGKAVEPFMIHGEIVRERPPGDEVKNTKKTKKSKFTQASKTDDEIRRVNNKTPHVILSFKSGQATGKTMPVNKNMRESVGGKVGDVTSAPHKNRANHIEPLKPLDTVLHIPPTETVEEQNSTRSPYLVTPPYVHHFDTYTLVQQVHSGGFTVEQSITTMKAVRALLAMNLEVAKASLVSKSDVENETYLFRAASSELKTEIQNRRRKNEETMRRERTQLQNEVDILNQKLSQELLALKEELKGMFDDRKMSVRMDQSTMESKIQELNYKITVMLNSDSKSEVEGLRWVLTRRSVMGILFMAFMVLTSLRYASYKSRENENRRKKESHTTSNEHDEILPVQGAAEILAAS